VLNASVLSVIRLGDPFTGAFMVYSNSYLYLSRHKIYYIRVIIPNGIKEGLHKLEYRRSLKTRCPHIARMMGRVLRACFEVHLEGVRADMITWEALREILDKRLVQLIAAEREKLSREGPYPLISDDIWKSNTIPNYHQAIRDISAARSGHSSNVASGATCIPEFAEVLAVDILHAAKIDLDKSSDLFRQFCEATVRMYLEYTQQRLTLNDEARSFKVVQQPSSPFTPSTSTSHVTGKRISEVVETYCQERVAGGNWTAKTETEYRAAYKLLINVIHDRPIKLVDYSAAQVFKATLMKLPANMNKKPLYRDKPINDVLEMQIPKDDLLSISKVNAYLMRVSALFNWAERTGYVHGNPFSGQKVKEKLAGHEKRETFSNTDLMALFSSPEYLNGKHKHPYHYWLPLLGLFTGARIDEICQLHLEDIYQVQDCWVFDFNDKGEKKLKNQSSARIIPIHSRLIDLGLIDYDSTLRKKGEVRLFPELVKRRDGYSQDASKWFSRYRTRCGVTDQRKTFHSFRHTVLDHLKKKDIQKEKIAAIAGHKDESITTGLYGKPYEPLHLVPVIQSLDFSIEVPHF
jgi:integrase